MKISIIILTYNEPIKLIKKCLDSCFKSQGNFSLEVILINNFFSPSQTKAVSALKKEYPCPQLKVFPNKKNLGFAAGINTGLKKAQGEYIFLLNPDAWLEKDTLDKLVNFAKNKKPLGIVAPLMLSPEKHLQPSNFGRFPSWPTQTLHKLKIHKIFPWGRYILPSALGKKYFAKTGQVDWVGGGAMLIKKKAIEKIGLFDPNFFLYIEDIDFCRRARKKGFEVWYYPKAKVYHKQGSSFERQTTRGRRQEARGRRQGESCKKWQTQSLQYYFRKYSPQFSIPKDYYAHTKYHLEPAGLRRLDFIVHSISDYRSLACLAGGALAGGQGNWQAGQVLTTNYSVLDLGCGQGNISFALASLGLQVLGVDIDKGLIAELNNKAKSLGLDNLQFKALDLNQAQTIKDLLKFGPFDLVVASEILEHLKSPQAFLLELQKILKPQGRIIVSIPNVFSFEEWVRFLLSRTKTGLGLKKFLKKYFLKKEPLVQTKTETPHLHFWHYWSFGKMAERAGFIMEKSFSQSAGFKSLYYILGRLFLKRGSAWFLRLDRWDSFLAQLIPAWAGDGMMFRLKTSNPKLRIKIQT